MRSKRETFWERVLASTVVIYTFCATFVVYKELRQYGTNWVLYFIIDVPTSWWNQVQKWAWLAAINFAIPQLYILLSARKAPHSVYVIIYAVISILALFAVVGVISQIRIAKREQKSG
jgi:hypothetical protein